MSFSKSSADGLLVVIKRDVDEFSVPSKVQIYLCDSQPVVLAAPKGILAARIPMEPGVGTKERWTISKASSALSAFTEGTQAW